MAALSWTSLALEDLRRINRYLSKEVDPLQAAKTLATIRYRLKLLGDFPHAGPPVEGREFRCYVIRGTRYVAAYRVRDRHVQILRVHHQRENWQMPD